jgi:hypothetical protein
MPETNSITFSHKEVAEALVKKQDLHEGLWGIYIEFAIGAANISQSPEDPNILPAAIVPVNKIGIQRFPSPNNLTVDAAVVNPLPKIKKSGKSKKIT